MAQNTSITLTEHFQNFTGQLVSEGRYRSVSEAVRAGLRLLEEREERYRALRQAIQEGLDSGFDPEPFDAMAFREQLQAEYGPAK